MKPLIAKFLKDILTVANGLDYDVGRFAWVFSVVAYVLSAVYSIATSHTGWEGEDFQNLGLGIGAVLAGGGAALHFKKETEPK